MEKPYAWGALLVEYSEGGEDLAPEEVARQIARIVEGMERGPAPGEEEAWTAAAKEALGTAQVARTNGCAANWNPIGDAFAAQYAAGAAHCHRAFEAIVADANAYHARWEIEERVKRVMPHGAARAMIALDAERWGTETDGEDVEALARSVAAAMTESGVDTARKRALVAEATLAICAGGGEPGALIDALASVADPIERVRAGAIVLAVAGTRAGWARAGAASNLEEEITGHAGEEPRWLAEARAEPAFGRQLLDAARRWSADLSALGEESAEMRGDVAQGVIDAEPAACMVFCGMTAGGGSAAKALIKEIRSRAWDRDATDECAGPPPSLDIRVQGRGWNSTTWR